VQQVLQAATQGHSNSHSLGNNRKGRAGRGGVKPVAVPPAAHPAYSKPSWYIVSTVVAKKALVSGHPRMQFDGRSHMGLDILVY
jgi:hypothetical protein